MTNRLFITLHTTGKPSSWLIQSSTGDTLQQGDTIDSLAHINISNQVDEIIGLIPGEMVSLLQVDIPSKQSHIIEKALPFAVESELAEDTNQFHLAYNRNMSGDLSVVAIHKNDLDRQFEYFRQYDLRPHAIVVDSLLLPFSEGNWSLSIDKNKCIIRTAAHDVLTCEYEAVETMLNICAENQHENLPEHLDVWSSSAFLKSEFKEIHHQCDNNFELLCTNYCQQTNINLLQGAYLPDYLQKKPIIAWKKMAMICAIFLILLMGLDLSKASYLQSIADNYQQENINLYKKLFPKDKKIINIRSQMQSHINGGTTNGNASFLSLLANASEPFYDMQQHIALRQLNYDQPRGNLLLEIDFSSFEKLNTYKKQLTDKAMNVDIISAINENDRTLARLKVSQ